MLLGDSVTFEIEPGLTASLTHTDLAVVANRTQVGFGLSRWPVYPWWDLWPQFIADVRPEVVVIQTGTWDVDNVWGGDDRIPRPDDPDWEQSFRFLIHMATDVLASGGAHVYWLTMLPSPDSRWPQKLNRLLLEVADADSRMSVIDLTPGFTDSSGIYISHIGTSPNKFPIRKVDGVHICREGARIAAQMIATSILTDAGLSVKPGWADGPWRADDRYDVDPCETPKKELQMR